ncbi:hypothetical protein LTR36_006094 [Oleoguttula mirabilis]|uniref:Uncharacterized protein n=1 Tax=Oleoguttula mirabilis TaxID=1507867 RepID=A0AAV9JCN8_9PEZI|nr:hypothetical protein LTR36_006094 [Oleoguttula mirabilis]
MYSIGMLNAVAALAVLGLVHAYPAIPTPAGFTTTTTDKRQLVTEWCQPWPACGAAALEAAGSVADAVVATTTAWPTATPTLWMEARGFFARRDEDGASPVARDGDSGTPVTRHVHIPTDDLERIYHEAGEEGAKE